VTVGESEPGSKHTIQRYSTKYSNTIQYYQLKFSKKNCQRRSKWVNFQPNSTRWNANPTTVSFQPDVPISHIVLKRPCVHTAESAAVRSRWTMSVWCPSCSAHGSILSCGACFETPTTIPSTDAGVQTRRRRQPTPTGARFSNRYARSGNNAFMAK